MSIYRREIDTQCCTAWMHGIRTINGQYPDDNRDFDIEAGDNIIITDVTGGIKIEAIATTDTDWSAIRNTPDTLAGYGITDAYTKTETDNLLNDKMNVTDAYTKAETDDLLDNKVGISGDQQIEGNLNLLRDLVIPNISASTLIRSYTISGKNSNNEYFGLGSMQIRRYGNRSRWRAYIERYMDTPTGGTSLIFDVFDSGRVYLFIENIVNGTTTNHTIIDSTP